MVDRLNKGHLIYLDGRKDKKQVIKCFQMLHTIQMSSNYKMKRRFMSVPMATVVSRPNFAGRPIWAKKVNSRRFLISALKAKKWGFMLLAPPTLKT